MSTNPTKWSNTPTIFLGYWQWVVWVCLIILWGWRSKGKPFLAMISFVAIFPPKTQENLCVFWCCNPLSANPTKWSNTLKQFVAKLLTNCLSVFDHFVKLVLKGLITFSVSNDGTLQRIITSEFLQRETSATINKQIWQRVTIGNITVSYK